MTVKNWTFDPAWNIYSLWSSSMRTWEVTLKVSINKVNMDLGWKSEWARDPFGSEEYIFQAGSKVHYNIVIDKP